MNSTKHATPKTHSTPAPFPYKDNKFTTHLRHSTCSETMPYNGSMWVAIHCGTYASSIHYLSAIAEHLKTLVPFKYTIQYGPDVEKLGGMCYARILSVQMHITFTIPDDDAVAALEAAGFYAGLEPTL